MSDLAYYLDREARRRAAATAQREFQARLLAHDRGRPLRRSSLSPVPTRAVEDAPAEPEIIAEPEPEEVIDRRSAAAELERKIRARLLAYDADRPVPSAGEEPDEEVIERDEDSSDEAIRQRLARARLREFRTDEDWRSIGMIRARECPPAPVDHMLAKANAIAAHLGYEFPVRSIVFLDEAFEPVASITASSSVRFTLSTGQLVMLGPEFAQPELWRGEPEFNPDQPRDEHGEWSGGGGGDVVSALSGDGASPSGGGGGSTSESPQKAKSGSAEDKTKSKTTSDKQAKSTPSGDGSSKDAGTSADGGGWTAANASEGERIAVSIYTGSDYVAINNKLRGVVKGGPANTRVIKALDAVTMNAVTDRTMTVYRGLGPRAIAALEKTGLSKGTTFTDKAFVSVTTSEDVGKIYMARDEKNILMEIAIPKGAHMADISPLSQLPYEKEALIARKSKFRIVSYSASTRILNVAMVA